MSDRDEFGAFLLGFIVGGLTGAVASLLLTPKSGDETRTMIKEKAIELGDKVNITVDDARQRADEITADARVRAESILAEARTRAETVAAEARKQAEEIQRRGQVVLEEQRSRVTKAVKSAQENSSAPAAGDSASSSED
jgi:gas vesicle protein